MCDSSESITTHAKMLAAGMTRRQIVARVRSGSLERIRRGVYGHPGACAPIRTAAAHGGVLACVSAARHAGLWVLSTTETVHVGLGAHGHAYPHDRCACTEHWDGPGGASTGHPIPQVLLQVYRCLGIEDFFVALESALRYGMLSARALDRLRAQGNAEVREAIAFARRDADSGIESLLRWRLRKHGLRIRSQVDIIAVGRVDFLIGDRLIVEADGADNHHGESQRHKDLMRDANAAAWGYITLRFDYAMIVHDWDTVEQAILAHIDRGDHVATRRGRSGGSLA